MKAKSLYHTHAHAHTHTHTQLFILSILNYKAYFHWRCSLCRAITEVWRSIWWWIGDVGEEKDTNRRRHERDIGQIESIIEPTVQAKDLFSISKHSQTRDATENGEHNGVFQQDFNESPLYILMMCKCESNNTESHSIGDTFICTNDRRLGPRRSHSDPLKKQLPRSFLSKRKQQAKNHFNQNS